MFPEGILLMGTLTDSELAMNTPCTGYRFLDTEGNWEEVFWSPGVLGVLTKEQLRDASICPQIVIRANTPPKLARFRGAESLCMSISDGGIEKLKNAAAILGGGSRAKKPNSLELIDEVLIELLNGCEPVGMVISEQDIGEVSDEEE